MPVNRSQKSDSTYPPAQCRHHEIEPIEQADAESAWGTADNYNPTHPLPAIDQVTIAITPNGPRHAT